MLVVIDIGNSNITIGIYAENKLVGNYRLTTKMKRTSDEYGFMILNFLNASKVETTDIDDVIISSVVPKIMHSFLNGIRKFMHKEPIVVGPGIKTGISVKADDPKAVGADRIVDAAGAFFEYGGPCLVVDFGTATTYDYVDEKGNFEFGVIALGIETSAQAMWTQAAKLPEIEIKKPKSILTKNTTTSMQAGLVYGYIGQSEYIIKMFKEALGSDMKVIATGGLGKIIYKNTEEIDIYDRDLTFKGLKSIYRKYIAEHHKK
ncbi:MAG: type III pantothenate kinase [Longicatena sp.]